MKLLKIPVAIAAAVGILLACGSGSKSTTAAGGTAPGGSPGADAGTAPGGGGAGGDGGPGAGADGGLTTSGTGTGTAFSATLPPETGTFTVQWKPGTTYVDRAHLSSLLFYDDDAHRYTFDSGAGFDLSVGRVIVIYGKALRVITASTTANGQTVIDTDFATFEDAMQEADIEVDQPMDFSSSTFFQNVRIRDPSTGEMHAPISSQDQEATFKIAFSSYILTMKISSKGQALGVSMLVERPDLLHLEFRADGQLETFTIHHKVNIHDGNLVLLDQTSESAKAKMALSLAMLGGGKEDLDWKPDIVFLKLPLVEVGPVPVVFGAVGIQFVVKIVSPSEGTSRLEATFSYDADTGFHYDGTNLTDVARQRTIDILKGQTQTGSVSPIGVNVGFNFPRFSVSAFNEIVTAWTGPGFLVGGSYTPFFPPCQTADADFLWTTKAQLKIFALKLSAEYKRSLIQKKVKLLRAGNCPPG